MLPDFRWYDNIGLEKHVKLVCSLICSFVLVGLTEMMELLANQQCSQNSLLLMKEYFSFVQSHFTMTQILLVSS